MIPLFRKLWDALLNDEMAVRRWLRAGLMAMAGSGLAFADQIAQTVGSPGAVKTVKITAVVCGFISVMINLGEKNEKGNANP